MSPEPTSPTDDVNAALRRQFEPVLSSMTLDTHTVVYVQDGQQVLICLGAYYAADAIDQLNGYARQAMPGVDVSILGDVKAVVVRDVGAAEVLEERHPDRFPAESAVAVTGEGGAIVAVLDQATGNYTDMRPLQHSAHCAGHGDE